MNDNVKSPWPGPAGMIPVTSGKADDANVFNRNYLDSIHVEMRVIDAVEPTLKAGIIIGESNSSPKITVFNVGVCTCCQKAEYSQLGRYGT